MNLLCHRGYWRTPAEQNTLVALGGAIDRNLGLETDIRDHNGRLVISHNPPCGNQILELETFLAAYHDSINSPLLALNIKADGLQPALAELLEKYQVRNYFVFDMSLPDTMPYLHGKMPVAARLSEYEDAESLFAHAETIWLDAFHSEWYTLDRIGSLLDQGKTVCVVSPELHRRPHEELWRLLDQLASERQQQLFLCTDLVDQAQEVFDVRVH